MDSHAHRVNAIFHPYICSSVYLICQSESPICKNNALGENIGVFFFSLSSLSVIKSQTCYRIFSLYMSASLDHGLNSVCVTSHLLEIISAIHLQIIAGTEVAFEKGWWVFTGEKSRTGNREKPDW